jgi:hypothetical protein
LEVLKDDFAFTTANLLELVIKSGAAHGRDKNNSILPPKQSNQSRICAYHMNNFSFLSIK